MSFFDNDQTKKALKNYMAFLKSLEIQDTFEKRLRDDLLQLLNIMHNASDEWERNTPYNIKDISNLFITQLTENDELKKKVHLTYALAIRFLIEFYLTTDVTFSDIYLKMKDNAYEFIDKINSPDAKWHLRFAFNGMSLEITKNVFSHEGFKVFQDYTAAKNSAEQLKNDWLKFIKEKEEAVKKLEKTLIEQKHSYQFVALNQGFQSLLEQKKSQLSLSRFMLIFLGLILPTTIFLEMFFFLRSEQEVQYQISLIKFIPVLSLTLILVYYFRIALQNCQSIKAQILQIEFRMTLCGFIQSYADYSAGIKSKNPNSLSKFEDVIFSNIMTSEDKIPSTFDGIEQISNLITSIRGGRDSSKN
ncbi:hypothetical protein [Duffyella gerundensis]|nr:hypothetical protein [Duffyella gerundensis]